MNDVVFTIKNKTGIITLNRPEKINVLTHEMIGEITKTLESWKNDKQILTTLQKHSEKELMREMSGRRKPCKHYRKSLFFHR